LKKGIPASNIIHMSPNDCATASFNPQPGTLYNKPSTGAGDNVFKGCVVDYDSDSVTVDNFLAILTGG
jgi:glycosylphosphatidylinositol transamidase (GPIT) subunit GPI8